MVTAMSCLYSGPILTTFLPLPLTMSDTPPIASPHKEETSDRMSSRWLWAPVAPSMRIGWAVVSLGMAAVLATAAWLEPAPEGMGTHQQLGLPSCSLVITSGLPCPTCGMTTAFAHCMRGQFISAFLAQPAGLVLWIGTVFICGYGAYVAYCGQSIWVNWDRIAAKIMLGLGILLILGWGFKIGLGLLTGELPMK